MLNVLHRYFLIVATASLIALNQGLQLEKIKDNPGILPINLGHAFKQEDKWTVIKVLDLSGLISSLYFNEHKYIEFKKLLLTNNQFNNEFLAIKKQVDYLDFITLEKLKQILPTAKEYNYNRVKRGILNPLGSLIKLITGNLDHEDANRYDNLISQIKDEQILTNKKITIISQMLDNLINSTSTLQENAIILDNKLRAIEEVVKQIVRTEVNSVYATHILMMFDIFNNNFRSIFMSLSEIETALALSKISVLHQSIINTTELLMILKSIDKTDNLMYPATLSNLVKIERTMIVKAYIKGDQITFILEIPLTDNISYNYFKLYLFPIFHESLNKTLVIFPKYPYLLVKGLKFIPITHPCEEIEENHFICSENNIALYSEETCIEQLMQMKQNLSDCTPVPVAIEDVRVQRIKYNSWIIFTKQNIVLMEKCDEDTSHTALQGSYILKMEENCEITLGRFHIKHRKIYGKTLSTNWTLVPELPDINVFSENSISNKTVNIKEINLDDLNRLSYVLKLTNNKKISESAVKIKSVSLATILLYLIIIIIIVILISFKYKNYLIKFLRNNPNQQSSDNSALGEGGVIHPQPPTIVLHRY